MEVLITSPSAANKGNASSATADSKQDIAGAVRIGRGNKLHPARKDVTYGLVILCRCPGTLQGSAYKHASFFAGVTGTCKG